MKEEEEEEGECVCTSEEDNRSARWPEGVV